jgi:hypothetical protein
MNFNDIDVVETLTCLVAELTLMLTIFNPLKQHDTHHLLQNSTILHFPTQCICVFCMVIRTNNEYFPVQYQKCNNVIETGCFYGTVHIEFLEGRIFYHIVSLSKGLIYTAGRKKLHGCD